jgi:hypothetical protein
VITSDTTEGESPERVFFRDVVLGERTVSTSLLSHLLKYYEVEDAKEIQGLCEEGTGTREE